MTKEQREAHERLMAKLPSRLICHDTRHFGSGTQGRRLSVSEKLILERTLKQMKKENYKRKDMHRLTGASYKTIARVLGRGIVGGKHGTR